jgi:hypothetical protein
MNEMILGYKGHIIRIADRLKFSPSKRWAIYIDGNHKKMIGTHQGAINFAKALIDAEEAK